MSSDPNMGQCSLLIERAISRHSDITRPRSKNYHLSTLEQTLARESIHDQDSMEHLGQIETEDGMRSAESGPKIRPGNVDFSSISLQLGVRLRLHLDLELHDDPMRSFLEWIVSQLSSVARRLLVAFLSSCHFRVDDRYAIEAYYVQVQRPVFAKS